MASSDIIVTEMQGKKGKKNKSYRNLSHELGHKKGLVALEKRMACIENAWFRIVMLCVEFAMIFL